MERTLSRNGWAFLLRGTIAVLFGVLAYAVAEASVQTLARIFGVFAIAEGALSIGATLGVKRERERPWAFVADGVVSVGFGLAALLAPWSNATTLMGFIAAWIAVVALLEAVAATKLEPHLATPRVLFGFSVVSLIAAAVIAFVPHVSSPMLAVWAFGAWATFFGVVSLLLGVVLRRDVRGRVRESLADAFAVSIPAPAPLPRTIRSSAPSPRISRNGRDARR